MKREAFNRPEAHAYALQQSATHPDWTTPWTFENRIGLEAASTIHEAVQIQPQQQGYLAPRGQNIDATLAPTPRQHIDEDDKSDKPFLTS
jgi:hypothetical protein